MPRRTNVAIGIAFAALAAALIAFIPREAPLPPSPFPSSSSSSPSPSPSPPALPTPGEISVLTLLPEMADLDHLTRLSSPAFVARQASSYDRRSRRPEDGDSWFANDDFATNSAPNLVRVETGAAGERRYVLLDAQGPGAVVRLWTATPAGTLRLFIDDDPRPALEAPMGALLAGRVEPFLPPFAQVTAMGHSLYFPFPFRKRCLVTIDTLDSVDPFSGRVVDKVYYQIGWRQYVGALDEQLRPFSGDEVARARPALARVAAALAANRPLEADPAPARTTIPIAPAKVDPSRPSITTVDAPAGGGLIRRLRLTTPERDPERLRATVVAISFDGEETVRAPLTDLFGSSPGLNPYDSLPFTVARDGTLTSRFPMPFRSRAVVTVAWPMAAGTPTPPPVEISGEIVVEPRAFAPDTTLLFHARARPSTALPTRPLSDWHIATLTGRGHQVGTLLGVRNPPGTFWWGEGDEKVFVDAEPFPSLFGTGTEDYFGYAWSSTERFAHPYHAQTLAPGPGDGFGGWFSMNRFLILDPVPFSTSLRFDLELWHWSETAVAASALLYWYAQPGGGDDLPR